MYKLLATDLDGTLLSNYGISPENEEALNYAKASGLYVVLCSGRSFISMDQYVKKLNLNNTNDYGICYNGGRVYKTRDFEPIYDVRIKNEVAVEILGYAKDIARGKLDSLCYIGDKLIAEEMTETINHYVTVSKIPINLMSYNSMEGDISKILLAGKKEDLLLAEEKLSKYLGKVAMYFSSNHLFDIVDKNVSKANGLKHLAEHLGIKQEEIIAVGDNYNDLSMIEYAGLGVAVANAVDEVKSAADYVLTSSCDQGALKEVVEKFIKREYEK